jgi:hypothetical protein
MVGSSVPAAAAGCSGAGAVGSSPVPDGEGAGVAVPGAVAGCPPPAAGGEGAGVAGSGAALVGAGGDCGNGGGAVCANAPAQSDEIKKEVDASSRGRNDTEAPCRGKNERRSPVRTSRRTETADRRSGISPYPPPRGKSPSGRASSSQASKRLSSIGHTTIA